VDQTYATVDRTNALNSAPTVTQVVEGSRASFSRRVALWQ